MNGVVGTFGAPPPSQGMRSLRSALYPVFSPTAHSIRETRGGIGSDVTTAFGVVRFVFFLSFSLSGHFAPRYRFRGFQRIAEWVWESNSSGQWWIPVLASLSACVL